MSRHKEHGIVSESITGDKHEEVHRLLDWPYRVLGRRHRILFHDPITAPVLGAFAAWRAGKSPLSGAKAGAVHPLQDRADSFLRRQPGVRQAGRYLRLADTLLRLTQEIEHARDPMRKLPRGRARRPVEHFGGEPMLRLRRDAAGRPQVDHGRVDLRGDDLSTNCGFDDLPDDVSQAEIDELREMGFEARTRSGRPGLATPPPTSTEQALRQAQMRAEIARLERDAAVAEAEAEQARIAQAHLVDLVDKKRRGIRLEQLFWLGGGGIRPGGTPRGPGARGARGSRRGRVGYIRGVGPVVAWRVVRGLGSPAAGGAGDQTRGGCKRAAGVVGAAGRGERRPAASLAAS